MYSSMLQNFTDTECHWVFVYRHDCVCMYWSINDNLT